MTVDKHFRERISQLVSAAGSQRRFADLLGKKSPTVIGWLNGSEPYETTLALIAKKTGVSLGWLRTGAGDDQVEISKFRARIGADTAVIRRHISPPMISDFSQGSTVGETPSVYGASASAATLLSEKMLISIIDEISCNEGISADERLKQLRPFQQELKRRFGSK